MLVHCKLKCVFWWDPVVRAHITINSGGGGAPAAHQSGDGWTWDEEKKGKRADTFWGRSSTIIISLRHSVKYILLLYHQPGPVFSLLECLILWYAVSSRMKNPKTRSLKQTDLFAAMTSVTINASQFSSFSCQTCWYTQGKLKKCVQTADVREKSHTRPNISSEVLRQDRKHQHRNSGSALLCLSARINNSMHGRSDWSVNNRHSTTRQTV